MTDKVTSNGYYEKLRNGYETIAWVASPKLRYLALDVF
jgi:hypothetical protein